MVFTQTVIYLDEKNLKPNEIRYVSLRHGFSIAEWEQLHDSIENLGLWRTYLFDNVFLSKPLQKR